MLPHFLCRSRMRRQHLVAYFQFAVVEWVLRHEVARQTQFVGIVHLHELRRRDAWIVWHRRCEVDEKRLATIVLLEKLHHLIAVLPHVVRPRLHCLDVEIKRRVAVAAGVVRFAAVVSDVTGVVQHAGSSTRSGGAFKPVTCGNRQTLRPVSSIVRLGKQTAGDIDPMQ